MPTDNITTFRNFLLEGLNYKNDLLFPSNPLCTAPLKNGEEEIVRYEAEQLRQVLGMFNKLFREGPE